jgi:hypothetical protein
VLSGIKSARFAIVLVQLAESSGRFCSAPVLPMRIDVLIPALVVEIVIE